MLHREEYLPLLDKAMSQTIQRLQAEGCIRFFGISVYTPQAALDALTHPAISIVQIPASLFDRRFENAGVFDKAGETGKTLHIRSALLQGVLCMPSEKLPNSLAGLRPSLRHFQNICHTHNVPFAATAIAWLLRRYPPASVLFGAETPEQVAMNLDFIYAADTMSQDLWPELDAVASPQEEHFLNPSLWKIHE
jgi:aryl-alcohol dehydrogenase-like predicted oxidoreductase